MSEAATLTASVAGRYANALFELARDAGTLDDVERDVDALKAALGDSADLRNLISSPLYSRDDQGRAIAALAEAMGLGQLTANLLGVMANKRRLFTLPDVLAIFGQLLADHRGEVTAEVASARPLSETQREALVASLSRATGREVKLDLSVDENLIGGLVVKMGSRMVDTSIRSKLQALETALKGVG